MFERMRVTWPRVPFWGVSCLVFMLAVGGGGCDSTSCRALRNSNADIQWEYYVDGGSGEMVVMSSRVGVDGSLYLAGVRVLESEARWTIAKHDQQGEKWIADLEVAPAGYEQEHYVASLHALSDGGALVATSVGRLHRVGGGGNVLWSSSLSSTLSRFSDSNDSGLVVLSGSPDEQYVLYRLGLDGDVLWSREVDWLIPVLHGNGEVSAIRGDLGSSTMSVVHFSEDGESIWSRTYHVDGCKKCEVISVQSLAECGLMVFAWDTHEDQTGTYLGRLNCDGEVVHFGKLANLRHLFFVAEFISSDLVLLAGMSCDAGERSNDVVLWGVDSTGVRTMEKWFGYEYKEGATSIRRHQDGTVAIAATSDRNHWVFGVSAD